MKTFIFFKKIFRPLIAAFFLIVLFRSDLIKIDHLKTSVQNIQLMALGFFLISLQYLFFALRWKLIVDLYKKISFFRILKLNLISQFFNTFIPGGIGGDVVKAIELANTEKIQKKQSFVTILIDRILGLYCMILFSSLFLFIELHQFNAINTYFYTSIAMLAIASLGLFFLKQIIEKLKLLTANYKSILLTKICAALEGLGDGFKAISRPKPLFSVIAFSFLAQVFAIYFIFLVVQSIVPSTPSLFLFFPLACFAFMASSLPITPGGIGFGQAAFYFIFSTINKDIANAVVIGISLLQLFNIIFSLPGAYFFTKISKSTT